MDCWNFVNRHKQIECRKKNSIDFKKATGYFKVLLERRFDSECGVALYRPVLCARPALDSRVLNDQLTRTPGGHIPLVGEAVGQDRTRVGLNQSVCAGALPVSSTWGRKVYT